MSFLVIYILYSILYTVSKNKVFSFLTKSKGRHEPGPFLWTRRVLRPLSLPFSILSRVPRFFLSAADSSSSTSGSRRLPFSCLKEWTLLFWRPPRFSRSNGSLRCSLQVLNKTLFKELRSYPGRSQIGLSCIPARSSSTFRFSYSENWARSRRNQKEKEIINK